LNKVESHAPVERAAWHRLVVAGRFGVGQPAGFDAVGSDAARHERLFDELGPLSEISWLSDLGPSEQVCPVTRKLAFSVFIFSASSSSALSVSGVSSVFSATKPSLIFCTYSLNDALGVAVTGFCVSAGVVAAATGCDGAGSVVTGKVGSGAVARGSGATALVGDKIKQYCCRDQHEQTEQNLSDCRSFAAFAICWLRG
jgi:hypothetical protein